MCRQEQEIALFRTACFVVESRPRRPLPKCHPSPPRRFELACCAIATTRAGHRWGGGPDRGRPGGVRGGAAGRERRRGDRGVGPCRAAAGPGTRDAASESDKRGNRADERLARAADAAETCDSWCLVRSTLRHWSCGSNTVPIVRFQSLTQSDWTHARALVKR